MKKIMMLLLMMTMYSGVSFADSVDDIFGRGDNDTEFDFERFHENNVMEAIAHDAGIACRRGLCTISSLSSKYKEITFNVNGGVGNNASGGFGGFGQGNNGTNINFNNNSGGLTFEDRVHANINIQLKVGDCETKVNVPRALYYALNRYLYGLMNEDSTTRRSFTPADEAMIIFYTTVSKQATSCK